MDILANQDVRVYLVFLVQKVFLGFLVFLVHLVIKLENFFKFLYL